VTNERRGCYGLQLPNWPGASDLLLPADPSWPLLALESRGLPTELPAPSGVRDTYADIEIIGGRLQMQRSPLRATYLLDRLLDHQALVHPYLAVPAAISNHWLGRQVFHAGAFVVDDGAWAIIAEKQGGKSSTLAWLDGHGIDVLTDDLLVVDAGIALAGPRCIDLRAETATALDCGTLLHGADGRDRWRLTTRGSQKRAPLRGWIVPAWDDVVSVGSLPTAERLSCVLGHRSVLTMDQDPEAFLELAMRPCLRFARPRSLEAMGRSIEALLTSLPT
jgi:hypothetical protein